MNLMRRLLKNEKGNSLLEYVLIIALIALVAVVGLSAYGDTMHNAYNSTGNKLDQNL